MTKLRPPVDELEEVREEAAVPPQEPIEPIPSMESEGVSILVEPELIPEPEPILKLEAVPSPAPEEQVTGAETHLSPGLLVAVLCRVDEESTNDDWMLATVRQFHPDTRLWEVEDCEGGAENETDEDAMPNIVPGGGNGKRRLVELARILCMPQSEADALEKEELKPKTAVLGLYPGTTCLYPAVVVTPPSRRKKTRDYLLRFNDDEVPSRPCPVQYVITAPGMTS